MDNSPIRDFYEDKTLFITGGTGFVGKVLVEKLLRSTNVKKIYLLIRPKKGVDPAERLDTILSSKMFDNLKLTQSSQLDKIVSIPGDVMAPNLGISTSDSRRLAEEVEIVDVYKKTYDMILDAFATLNVTKVETVGTEFNYTMHQAMMQMPSDEYDEGIVCQEFAMGWRCGDKLIHPAMQNPKLS